MSDVKERIYSFIRHMGIPVAFFEQKCGLSNGYVSSMRKGFGMEKLERVLKEFPQLNRNWLLFGEGNMLQGASEEEASSEDSSVMLSAANAIVHYYELTATASNVSDFTDNEIGQPYKLLYVKGLEGTDGFTVSGKSMAPTLNEGDVACVQRHPAREIINGEIYMVVTRDGQRMFKRLVRDHVDEEGIGHIMCYSDNPNQVLYAPFEITTDRIHHIARVVGFVSVSMIL